MLKCLLKALSKLGGDIIGGRWLREEGSQAKEYGTNPDKSRTINREIRKSMQIS